MSIIGDKRNHYNWSKNRTSLLVEDIGNYLQAAHCPLNHPNNYTIIGAVDFINDNLQPKQDTKSVSEVLIPFDLEVAKNKPENVRYANGEKPRYWCVYEDKIITLSDDCIKRQHKYSGVALNTLTNTFHLMLVDGTPETVLYGNVYPNSIGDLFKTIEQAKKVNSFTKLAILKITTKGKTVKTEIVHTY